MHRRAARAIVVRARRRDAAVMGTGAGVIMRAAGPGFFRVETRERKAGARGVIGEDSGIRGNSVRVPVQRRCQQLRDASKQDKATAGSTWKPSRGASRKTPAEGRLETARAHLLHLWSDSNDYFLKIASVSCVESIHNRR
jgi:hypothetical protein